jgi:uncharacterized protein
MRYRVIIQLTNSDELVIKSLLSQIKNLINALNGEVDIELTCHGQSISFVLNAENKWADAINSLLDRKVTILACEQMLKGNGKAKTDLYPGINSTPSAIAAIVKRQTEGWSYIKAGL